MGCKVAVGRSTPIIPTKTILDSLVENGRSLTSVPQEDAFLSFPDQWRLLLAFPFPPTWQEHCKILESRPYFSPTTIEISCLWLTGMKKPGSRLPLRFWQASCFP
ncbi:Hypothetical predicted protein [Prunus dulcis]|uniref:Uncharacterized protein n=1 Tax=Prunus dulcis TaxID=3755 RepID=A0A5E4FVS5_PRUDU|nr:Hypothetical predicted protein [Prunus dulcis]